MASDWQVLLRTGGCLTGGQDWSPDGLSEGSVLHAAAWQQFLQMPLEAMAPFLTSRLGSTQLTEMHVCPHAEATEGEMALYCLQLRLHANWVDMPSECHAIEEARLIHATHRQKSVRKILGDPSALRELNSYFNTLAEAGVEEKTELERLEEYRLALRADTEICFWPIVVTELGDAALFVGGVFSAPAGSYRSALLVSRDGGKEWEDTGIFRVGGQVLELYALDAKRAWMATGHAVEGSMGPYHIWRTKDGGRTWRRCPTALPKRHLGIDGIVSWRFSSSTDGEAVIAGSIGEMVTYTTHDGGMTWKETASEYYDYDNEIRCGLERPQRRFLTEVDYDEDVVRVRRWDELSQQWLECGRLPRTYELRPEPLFPAER